MICSQSITPPQTDVGRSIRAEFAGATNAFPAVSARAGDCRTARELRLNMRSTSDSAEIGWRTLDVIRDECGRTSKGATRSDPSRFCSSRHAARDNQAPDADEQASDAHGRHRVRFLYGSSPRRREHRVAPPWSATLVYSLSYLPFTLLVLPLRWRPTRPDAFGLRHRPEGAFLAPVLVKHGSDLRVAR